MIRRAPLRRRLALWLCPDLAPASALWPADPIDLPLWPTLSCPKWWGNAELRQYLTASHRQMRIVAAHAEAVSRFGGGVPSLSALHRYWQPLDAYRDAQTPETHSQKEPR